MKFLKNNMFTLLSMVFLFTMVMMGDASATVADGTHASVFGTARGKLLNLFRNAKMVVFVIGGFGLIALAFQAVFGKVKWAWFAALAFGLAVVAAAGAIVEYASNTTGDSSGFSDSLLGGTGDA
ncbi:MAG: hypothetical protein IJ525_02370 [Alphaproteobacteria bacterium]|nr:hypothetical protein [Alphaproteobacteria bacterium]MBR3502407.1 hypothetical protein [Alphaproteobacteria bacterium]